jgi:hypothetical protein
MGNSISKLEIFRQLMIQRSDLFVNLTNDLVSLKEQLTDNDESNVKVLEKWIDELPENEKENILEEYEYRQLNVEQFGRDGQSPTKPGQTSEMLKETLENVIVPAEKTPKKDGNTSETPK